MVKKLGILTGKISTITEEVTEKPSETLRE